MESLHLGVKRFKKMKKTRLCDAISKCIFIFKSYLNNVQNSAPFVIYINHVIENIFSIHHILAEFDLASCALLH